MIPPLPPCHTGQRLGHSDLYRDWETARYNAGVEYKNAPFNTAQDKANNALLYRRFHRLARMGDNA